MHSVVRNQICAALSALLLVFGAACSEDEERVIEYDGFVLSERPSEQPRVFPPGFIYPGSVARMSGEYTRSPYASSREGVIIYDSTDPLPQIQAFYLRRFDALGWQIIQSQERDGEVLLLAENLSRRLFTVILRDRPLAEAESVAGDADPVQANGSPEPAADGQPDAPLKPLARADSATAANVDSAAETAVEIKLYIKQAGIR